MSNSLARLVAIGRVHVEIKNIYVIFHVTSQNDVFEGPSNIMSRNSSLHVTTQPSLVAIGTAIVEMFLFCHRI